MSDTNSSEKVNLQQKTILITGAAGKIGMSLRHHLGKNYRFRCLDIEPINNAEDMRVADINDFTLVLQAMEGVDCVIHLAANPNIHQPWQDVYETAIRGTYNVFEAARQAGIKKIIYASSCYVMKGWGITEKKIDSAHDPVRPDSLYGVGKAFGENLGYFMNQKYNISVICLRIGTFKKIPPLDNLENWTVQLWCSPRDLAHLVDQILKKENLGFQIFYAISNNRRRFVDISNAQKLVEYKPKDDVDEYYTNNLSTMLKKLILEKLLRFPQIIWPTETQQLLLKALFASQEDFIERWQTWNQQINIEDLDENSSEFLGLLYQKLTLHQVEAEYREKLKGIYKYNWSKNQIKLQEFKKISETLTKYNIESIWVNALALAACYYKDYGTRNIPSFCLLVDSKDYQKTQEILLELDWEMQEQNFVSCILQKYPHQLLYLETRLFWAEPQDYTDSQLWQHAVMTEVENMSTRILSTTDQFLYLCLNTHSSPHIPLIHWFVDAITILSMQDPAIDWGRLVTQAQRYQLILPLRNILSFLQHLVGLSLPDWVFPTLYGMPVSNHELTTYYVLPSQRFLKIKSLLLHIIKMLQRNES